ncbi:MAG: MafI family immunity protein [Pirellulaceae bacterium]
MQLAEKIKQLSSLFTNRLAQQILADAIEYAEFSECKLAVEMLCDQLFEYDVPISVAEFKQIRDVADESGADSERVESLRSLVLL